MKLEMFLGFSVALTMLLFITQTTMDNVALDMSEDPTQFYNVNNSHLSQFDQGNYTISDDYSGLPSPNEEVDEGTSNIFTDTFKAVTDWIYQTSGLKYVVDVLNAVPNFLKQLFGEEYKEIAFALGYFWHVISFIIFIAWVRGVAS